MLTIKIIGTSHCIICGAYLPDGGEHCYHCTKKTKHHFEYIRSSGVYEGLLRDLIHKFKYHNKEYLSRFLGFLLVKSAEHYSDFRNADYIVPVPMHWSKQIKRGYNHAELLSSAVATYLHKPVLLRKIKRARLSKPQVSLRRAARLVNVADCFAIHSKEDINGKTILLVDDVCTTAATIDECAKLLKHEGANKVYGLTVARN